MRLSPDKQSTEDLAAPTDALCAAEITGMIFKRCPVQGAHTDEFTLTLEHFMVFKKKRQQQQKNPCFCYSEF